MKRRLMALAWATSLPLAAVAGDFEKGVELKKAGKLKQAAEVFEEILEARPGDADSLEQLATVQGWMGDYAAAVATWRKALAGHPSNSDYRLGLARVLYWRKANGQSLRELDVLLSRDPRNAEALTLKGDVLAASGNRARAEAAYRQAKAASPMDRDIDAKIERLREAVPLHWRLDAGYTADSFSGLRGHEHSEFGQIGYMFDAADNVWVHYDYLHEFDQTDKTILFGGAAKLGESLLIMPSFGRTPHPHFRSENQFELGAEWQGLPYVTPLAAYRYYHYDVGRVRIYIPGARLQFAPSWNVELRYSNSHNADRTITDSYSGRLNYFIGDVLAPYLAYAHGVEDLPPLASARVTYYSAGCVWNINRHVGVRADYTYEDRPGFYTHNSLGGGVTLKL